MLKINTVYLYKEKLYIAVLDRIKKKTRYTYVARKVKSTGYLGPEFKFTYNKKDFIEVKEAKLALYVELPKKDKDHIRYGNVIDSAKEVVAYYRSLKKNDPNRILSQREIGMLAFSVTSIYNGKLGRSYNLRDFAKSLGFKQYKTLYSWVASYLKTQFVEAKYDRINDTATKTLRTCIRNYQKNWKSITGFNKEVDALIKRDFLEYSKELTLRGEVVWDD